MNINIKNAHIDSLHLCGNQAESKFITPWNESFNAFGMAHNLMVQQASEKAIRLMVEKKKVLSKAELDTIKDDVWIGSALQTSAFPFLPLAEETVKALFDSLSNVLKEAGADQKALQSKLMTYHQKELPMMKLSPAAYALQSAAVAIAWYGAALYAPKNLQRMLEEAGGSNGGEVVQAINVGTIIRADIYGILSDGTRVGANASYSELMRQLNEHAHQLLMFDQ